MREIKFRGYDLDSKCWRYGYYFLKEDITLCAIYDSKEQWEKDKEKNEHHLILWNGFSDWNMPKPHYQSEVDGKSVGQFTGLYDKNKKEIYNGDIVKSTKSKYKRFDDDGIYEVYFNKFLCHYALIASRNEWETKHGQYDNYSLTECKAKEFEVIGNIYENAELLESEDKNV